VAQEILVGTVYCPNELQLPVQRSLAGVLSFLCVDVPEGGTMCRRTLSGLERWRGVADPNIVTLTMSLRQLLVNCRRGFSQCRSDGTACTLAYLPRVAAADSGSMKRVDLWIMGVRQAFCMRSSLVWRLPARAKAPTRCPSSALWSQSLVVLDQAGAALTSLGALAVQVNLHCGSKASPSLLRPPLIRQRGHPGRHKVQRTDEWPLHH